VNARQPIIRIQNLDVFFYKGKGILSKLFGKGERIVHAVNDLTLNVNEQETVGIVGESGCGKSTLAKSIVGLVTPTSGAIFFQGEPLSNLNKAGLRQYRRNAQMIFQDPISSLNPRMTAFDIIAEPFRTHGVLSSEERIAERVRSLLDQVGLAPSDGDKYPHEFSGGQARRIGVARALALHPKVIVADEPNSGLDVSVMAKILNLMIRLQDEFSLTYVWISHNLHAVHSVADRICVMYLGRIMEIGRTEQLIDTPKHPYTQALLSAVPLIGPSDEGKVILEGEVPSPIDLPSGCPFHTRCWMADHTCKKTLPELQKLPNGNRSVACLKTEQ